MPLGCHALLQGIFPTQGLSPGLLHCRQILYHLIHQGSPLESLVGDYSIAKASYPKDSQTLLCELKNGLWGKFFEIPWLLQG